jgi:hypothetical protein
MFLSIVTRERVIDKLKRKVNSRNLYCRSVINPLSSYVISKINLYLICRLSSLTLLQDSCLSYLMIF